MRTSFKVGLLCLLLVSLVGGGSWLGQLPNDGAVHASENEAKSKDQGSKAFALIQVSRQTPTALSDAIPCSESDYKLFQQTQIELIRSPVVLNAAARKKSIRRSSILEDLPESKRTRLVRNRLRVRFLNGSEILEISMIGEEPEEELIQVIKGVADSYMNEIVSKRHMRKKTKHESIRRLQEQLTKDLEEKSKTYFSQVRSLGVAGSSVANTDRELILHDLKLLKQQRVSMQNKLLETEVAENNSAPSAKADSSLAVEQEFWKIHIDRLEDEIAEKSEDARKLGSRDAEMELLASEIEQLKRTQRLLSEKLSHAEIESDAGTERIRVIQPAVID